MIDTVTMVLALMSGSIFLAHALDGLRSRAWSRRVASIAKQTISNLLTNSEQHPGWQVNHASWWLRVRWIPRRNRGEPCAALFGPARSRIYLICPAVSLNPPPPVSAASLIFRNGTTWLIHPRLKQSSDCPCQALSMPSS